MRRSFGLAFAVALISGGFILPVKVWASLPMGVATYIHIDNAEQVSAGAIISNRDSGYTLSQEPYDRGMVGVVTRNPALAFTPDDTTGQIAMVTDGTVNLLVTGENGPIAKGDKITSSSQPGVGMKATKTGFILGVAQQSFDPATDPTGMIIVVLDPKLDFGSDSPQSETIGNKLLDAIKLSGVSIFEEPSKVFRTVVASFVIIAGTVICFATFFRVSQKGIEAIGRNPLATKAISFGMLVNIALAMGVVAASLMAAQLILKQW